MHVFHKVLDKVEDQGGIEPKTQENMKLLAIFALLCVLGVNAHGEDLQESDVKKQFTQCRHSNYRTWYSVGGLCVKYIPEYLTFQEAEYKCEGMCKGGHLVSLHTSSSNSAMGNFVRHYTRAKVWLGGEVKHGHWIWTDGGCFNYKNFIGHPATLRHSCLSMTGGYTWNPVSCNQKISFICGFPE
ncbi:snaclec alboaggregin-D subunit beta-like [Arapaima gigas]